MLTLKYWFELPADKGFHLSLIISILIIMLLVKHWSYLYCKKYICFTLKRHLWTVADVKCRQTPKNHQDWRWYFVPFATYDWIFHLSWGPLVENHIEMPNWSENIFCFIFVFNSFEIKRHWVYKGNQQICRGIKYWQNLLLDPSTLTTKMLIHLPNYPFTSKHQIQRNRLKLNN